MLNQCNFVGRCGSDVEIRYTQQGTAVANMSIACSETWKGQDGQKNEKTEWVKIVAWGKLAEIMGEHVSKGSLVYISGKLQTRKWEDKEGNTRYTTEIVAREMKMLSPRSNSGHHEEPPSPEPEMGEDIPF